MRWSWRILVATVVCVLVGACWCASSVAEEVLSGLAGSSVGSVSLLGGPLVTEGLLTLGEFQAEEEVRLTNPEAVWAREESEQVYSGLSAAGSEELVGKVFPGLVDSPDGGPPQLPEGDRVVGFPSDYAASVVLPEGKHGVVESLAPIAVMGPSGRVPVDLTPRQSGFGFEAVASPVGARVRAGARLSEGASIASLGMGLTPVTEAGEPIEATGRIDGTSVFYANNEADRVSITDTDTMVKFAAYGFREDSILRSQFSPERLFFRVGLPQGASLVQQGEGPVEVVVAGEVVALLLAPNARDAAGTVVPVKTSLAANNAVVLTVPHPAGRYKYPIVVDPYAVDKQVMTEGFHESNWMAWSSPAPPPSGPFHFREFNGYLEDRFEGTHGAAGWWGKLEYATQGTSHIGSFAAYLFGSVLPFQSESQYVSRMSIGSSGGATEAELVIPGYFNEEREGVCAKPCNSIYEGTAGNHAVFGQYFEKEGSDGFWTLMDRPEVVVSQESTPTISVNTTQGYVEGIEPASGGRDLVINAAGMNGNAHVWVNPHRDIAMFAMSGNDDGMGVYKVKMTSAQEGREGYYSPYRSWTGPLTGCKGIECPETPSLVFSLADACGQSRCTWLPEGEDSLTAEVEDATGEWSSSWVGKKTGIVYIDEAPPHNLVLSGLPSSDELGAGEYHLRAEATDGAGSTKSSGIKSLQLLIDGRQVGEAPGYCPQGPCTVSNEWTVTGRNYAAGTHVFAVVATDNAGNIAVQDTDVTVRLAETVAFGPGKVNPESGDYTLSSTDVDSGGISTSRSYDSSGLTAGAGGPLGPQWAFGIDGQESLVKQADGSMVLTDSAGAQTIFAAKEGGFTSPPGDSNVTLSVTKCETGPQTEYMLSNAARATSTCFRAPTGGGSEVFMPSITKDAVPTDTVTYSFETLEVPSNSGKVMTRPIEALAPIPAGVSCSPELKPGCRALTFNYATTTTATGEEPSEWGDYIGDMTRVYYTAYDPASASMKTLEVEHYLYDKQGRLRAEWDPRIAPALKTIYGYDNEGHVTAITYPGQETWTLTYGSVVGDGPASRLLKVNQAPTSSALWSSGRPANTEPPVLSGSPVIGTRMGVSNGIWSGSPVGYAYRWKDCQTLSSGHGSSCTAIIGATNANYTPTSSDLGLYLVAEVTATNGGGSVTGESLASQTAVATTAPGSFPSYTQTIDDGNSINAASCIPGTAKCIVSDSKGNAYYTTNASVSTAATWTAWNGPGATPSEAVSCPTTSLCLIAAGVSAGNGGNLYYATSLGGAWSLAYAPTYGVDALSCVSASFCVDGQNGGGNFRYSTMPASTAWALESQGSSAMKSVSCISASFCAIIDGNGAVHVATTTGQIESSAWTETQLNDLEGQTKIPLNAITCTSTSSCVVADNAGNILNVAIAVNGTATVTKHNIDGTNKLTSAACPSTSICVTVDNQGSIFVSTNGGSTWTSTFTTGSKLTSVSCASASLCMAGDSSGRVTTFNPSFTQKIDAGNELNAVSCIPSTTDCVVSDSKGNAFYATNVNVNAGATWNSWSGPGPSPSDAVSCPTTGLCTLAAGANGGNLYYATSLGGAWSLAYAPTYGVDALSCVSASFCVDGQNGGGGFRYSTAPASTAWALELQGSSAMKSVSCISASFCAIIDGNGAVHVATTTGQIESSAWTETQLNDLEGQTKIPLNAITCTSTSSCVVADNAGNILNVAIAVNGTATVTKHNIDGTNKLTATTCANTTCVAVDNAGSIFVSTSSGETWTSQYHLGDNLTGVSCNSSTQCVTIDTTGNITTFNPTAAAHEAELRAPQPGSTIEYNIPVSGSGLPTLTTSEVEKWGQEDAPVEGSAMFPPDEPQTWPASGYKHATLSYFDALGRNVNTVSSSGAIGTTEYNSKNDITKTLSPNNRLAALKEANPRTAAATLDTQNTYNSEGTELLSTLEPRHTIKLANSKEVQARLHTVYNYDEGAPSEGGPFRLVTKTTQGAQIEGETEQEIKTTTTAYSGQGGLGWTLRAPTSTVVEPNGSKITTATVYDPQTGNVLETRRGASAIGGTYNTQFGNGRGGNGKLNWPKGIAVDSKGNIWVADTHNDRVQEFSSTGGYIGQFGSQGTGNGQMEHPTAIAADGKGHVWIVDSEAQRVQELSETGAYISKFGSEGTGNGQFKNPEGLAIDSKGNIWVVDTGNNRVQEFNSSGTYLAQFGTEGTGNGQFREPRRVLVDSKGNIWISDGRNSRIQEFNEKREFVRAIGSFGSGNGQLNDPEGLLLSAGHLFVADENNNRVEQFSETGEYQAQFGTRGSGNGQFIEDEDVAANAAGNLWVLDSGNSRAQEFSSSGSYLGQFGSNGEPEGELSAPKGIARDNKGHVWIADSGNNRIDQYTESGEFISKFGSEGSGTGQFKTPRAITVDPKGNIWIADQGNNRVDEFNEKGEPVRQVGSYGAGPGQFHEPQGIFADSKGSIWVSDTLNNRVEKFNEKGEYVTQIGTSGSGNGQLDEPYGLVVDTSGHVWIADAGNNRIEEFNEGGGYLSKFGTWGTTEEHLGLPLGIVLDSTGRLWVVDSYNNRVQEFTQAGALLATVGTLGSGEGQMSEPRALAINSKGEVWIADTNNNRIERWTIATPSDNQTIYYSTAENSAFPSCGGHPEWASMPCETLPSAQPETAGLPALPATTVTYNMLDEPLVATNGTGTQTRTSTITYDEVGRTSSTQTTSTTGGTLPKVTDRYSETTGAPIEQSSIVEGKTQTIATTYNTSGQLASYTDADGNTTKYEYEGEGNYQSEHDGRLRHIDDGKGTQTYIYDETTGNLKELTDMQGTHVLTFTASYDSEGNILSETYPNGMSAKYTTNQNGETTAVSYTKTTNCGESCTWYSDSETPTIHGQWQSEQSTLANQNYNYDEIGRLTEVKETPTSQGCNVRIYTYDEETNRKSLTSRNPGTGGSCATEGGNTETHSYDSANRLTDPGVTYNPFGEITKLPSTDAGGTELTSSYYANGHLESEAQAGQNISYQLDPEGRVHQTIDTGTINATYTSHYATPGESPAWTTEPVSGHWKRYINGISGLNAIETDTEEPVLQLRDLKGDIVARASSSETATKLLSTERSTEYGTPTTSKPEKYAWHGNDLSPTELPSGQVSMGARSYIPQLGRFLQTDPQPGGSANAYAYTYGNPINESDPSGELTYGTTEAGLAEAETISKKIVNEALAREQAAREEAELDADPCGVTKVKGSALWLGATIATAWYQTYWCWTNSRVVLAHNDGREQLAIYHFLHPLEYKFIKWEDKAYWSGLDYIIERIAWFHWKLKFCGIDKDGEGPPVCPNGPFNIELTLVLEPGGKYQESAIVHKYFS